MKPGPKPTAPVERMRRLTAVDTETECWNFTGKPSTKGYGRMNLRTGAKRGVVYLHRWSYEYFIGPIPEGLTIDHLCRNRLCCNPEHLEAVTPLENYRRGKMVALKTHCFNGHPWIADTAYRVRRKDGSENLYCRTCLAENQARAAKRKARVPARHHDENDLRASQPQSAVG